MYNTSKLFPESRIIAEYISNHSSSADTIAVIGSEPQIYFYANRKSATGYIYVYGLMEPHVYASKMQKEMIREIETAKPRYMVVVNANSSWLVNSNSDLHILDWTKKYLEEHYLLRGVINSMTDLKIRTDINPRYVQQVWNHTLSILERKQQ
jgi:hypothetical protein